jgi:hypothetical protein
MKASETSSGDEIKKSRQVGGVVLVREWKEMREHCRSREGQLVVRKWTKTDTKASRAATRACKQMMCPLNLSGRTMTFTRVLAEKLYA